jgi:hypothetical protein
LKARWQANDFGPELGAIDGTKAHAFERVLPSLVSIDGFMLDTYGYGDKLNPYKI